MRRALALAVALLALQLLQLRVSSQPSSSSSTAKSSPSSCGSVGAVIAWNWQSDIVLPPPPASYSPGQLLSPLWSLDSRFAYLVTVNLSVSEQLLTSSPVFTVYVGGSSQSAAQQVAVLTGNDPVDSSVSGVLTRSEPETVLHFSVSDGLPAGFRVNVSSISVTALCGCGDVLAPVSIESEGEAVWSADASFTIGGDEYDALYCFPSPCLLQLTYNVIPGLTYYFSADIAGCEGELYVLTGQEAYGGIVNASGGTFGFSFIAPSSSWSAFIVYGMYVCSMSNIALSNTPCVNSPDFPIADTTVSELACGSVIPPFMGLHYNLAAYDTGAWYPIGASAFALRGGQSYSFHAVVMWNDPDEEPRPGSGPWEPDSVVASASVNHGYSIDLKDLQSLISNTTFNNFSFSFTLPSQGLAIFMLRFNEEEADLPVAYTAPSVTTMCLNGKGSCATAVTPTTINSRTPAVGDQFMLGGDPFQNHDWAALETGAVAGNYVYSTYNLTTGQQYFLTANVSTELSAGLNELFAVIGATPASWTPLQGLLYHEIAATYGGLTGDGIFGVSFVAPAADMSISWVSAAAVNLSAWTLSSVPCPPITQWEYPISSVVDNDDGQSIAPLLSSGPNPLQGFEPAYLELYSLTAGAAYTVHAAVTVDSGDAYGSEVNLYCVQYVNQQLLNQTSVTTAKLSFAMELSATVSGHPRLGPQLVAVAVDSGEIGAASVNISVLAASASPAGMRSSSSSSASSSLSSSPTAGVSSLSSSSSQEAASSSSTPFAASVTSSSSSLLSVLSTIGSTSQTASTERTAVTASGLQSSSALPSSSSRATVGLSTTMRTTAVSSSVVVSSSFTSSVTALSSAAPPVQSSSTAAAAAAAALSSAATSGLLQTSALSQIMMAASTAQAAVAALPSGSGGLSYAAIAGIAVAGVVLLLLICVALSCLRRRSKAEGDAKASPRPAGSSLPAEDTTVTMAVPTVPAIANGDSHSPLPSALQLQNPAYRTSTHSLTSAPPALHSINGTSDSVDALEVRGRSRTLMLPSSSVVYVH